MFLFAPHPIDSSLGSIAGHSITQARGTSEEISLFLGGFECKEIRSEDALDSGCFYESEPFSITETACAFRLPNPPLQEQPGLPIRRSRTSLASLSSQYETGKDSNILFYNEHMGMTQPVCVNVEDRMRHVFIIGQTGIGKSTLIESMVLQNLRAGFGCAVIDPHGDLVDSLLGKIPEKRISDIVLLDLLEKERPLGINIIQWDTLEERDLMIDELYLAFDHIYDMKETGGPVFESNFRGMLKLLCGDKKREGFTPTLLEFNLCYLESSFREWLMKDVNDPQIVDFIKELERTGGETRLENLSSYITSKFNRFIHDTRLKRIIGQEKTSFDFDEIMNHGKILLVKLGKGRFGATISALITNYLVSRFKLAAMKRGDIMPEKRRDFFLYVDEAHNLPAENLIELLSDARKFRMGLCLATQYTAQFDTLPQAKGSLLSAILGNVGTSIVFRLGIEDAINLVPVLYPYFNSNDIIGLPNFEGYARMQINGEATPPFSFKTIKDNSPYDNALASNIRSLSRLKYGTDAKIVDERILRRRRIWKI